MKKVYKNSLIAILVVLLVGTVFYFNSQQTFIGVGGIPLQSEPFMFDNISGIVEAPFFGSIANNALDESDRKTRGICGSNDGDVFIANDFEDGGALFLHSYISSTKQVCGPNGISTKLTLPRGKLIATCITKASEENDGSSLARCKVGDEFESFANWRVECGWSNRNVDWLKSNCNSPKTETKTILISEETDLDILISTSTGNSGTAEAELTLDFIPEITQTYYRLTNNSCSEIVSFSDEITEFDYTTSAECSLNVVAELAPVVLAKPNISSTCSNIAFCEDAQKDVIEEQRQNVIIAFWNWIKSLFRY